MTKQVLSVGQCGADDYSIRHLLETNLDVQVTSADTLPEALDKVRGGSFALVLVNRVFDANGDSGLKLIDTLKADASLAAIPVMLVSNFSEAQQQAVAKGALAGFGKGGLRDTKTVERLRAALGNT